MRAIEPARDALRTGPLSVRNRDACSPGSSGRSSPRPPPRRRGSSSRTERSARLCLPHHLTAVLGLERRRAAAAADLVAICKPRGLAEPGWWQRRTRGALLRVVARCGALWPLCCPSASPRAAARTGEFAGKAPDCPVDACASSGDGHILRNRWRRHSKRIRSHRVRRQVGPREGGQRQVGQRQVGQRQVGQRQVGQRQVGPQGSRPPSPPPPCCRSAPAAAAPVLVPVANRTSPANLASITVRAPRSPSVSPCMSP